MARSFLRRRGHLGFCHYERSEVIQKQVLLAMGLLATCKQIASVTTFHRNDKKLAASSIRKTSR